MLGKRSDQQRTSEDRARAAAERAARRAGRPLPPEAFEDAVRPPDIEPLPPEPVEPEPEPEPVAEEPPPEPVHQPTVEYTPFETDEHEAPLGDPRDDEPRLIAARARPPETDDEVHAYAVTRGDTAEQDGFDETDERPVVPLRRAPDASRRIAAAAPRSQRPPPPPAVVAAQRRRPPLGPPDLHARSCWR